MDMNTRLGIRDLHDDCDHTEISGAPRERYAKSADARPVVTLIGSGWYHDAAIEQARLDAIEARCNPYA